MNKRVGDFHTDVTMTADEAKEVCRVGQGARCCAFLVMVPTGFECIRMSYPNNSIIFDRLANGTMNARGEGGWEGCAWHGEIDNSDAAAPEGGKT
jgi:hypothetical protein